MTEECDLNRSINTGLRKLVTALTGGTQLVERRFSERRVFSLCIYIFLKKLASFSQSKEKKNKKTILLDLEVYAGHLLGYVCMCIFETSKMLSREDVDFSRHLFRRCLEKTVLYCYHDCCSI